jgi:hypothetical protein
MVGHRAIVSSGDAIIRSESSGFGSAVVEATTESNLGSAVREATTGVEPV